MAWWHRSASGSQVYRIILRRLAALLPLPFGAFWPALPSVRIWASVGPLDLARTGAAFLDGPEPFSSAAGAGPFVPAATGWAWGTVAWPSCWTTRTLKSVRATWR